MDIVQPQLDRGAAHGYTFFPLAISDESIIITSNPLSWPPISIAYPNYIGNRPVA
ncbi:hypothetical protein C8R42DRAFT_678662 [Lentinula raphanica]|nr:hypothetical protein C8R42DRAFT_678662 [Lentinula raphanica]